MRIIENPSDTALQKLQEVLEKESPEGIVDIWCLIQPFYLAAEDAGSIVGVASISWGDDCAEIYKIYVAPHYRRGGIAKQLFGEALQRFRQNGIKQIVVETASEAGFSLLRSVTNGMHVDDLHDNKYIIQLDY